MILHVARTMPEGADGLRVRASRSDDLGGVTLRVTLVQGRYDDGSNRGGWSYGTPGGGWGTMTLSHGLDEATWKDEGEDVDRAFAAPPDRDVVVQFSILREP
jgi:hypothetical protein